MLAKAADQGMGLSLDGVCESARRLDALVNSHGVIGVDGSWMRMQRLA